jgi:hypothetical protein
MKNYEALKQQGDVIWNIANLLLGPYEPPRPLAEIEADIETLEGEIMAMLKAVTA